MYGEDVIARFQDNLVLIRKTVGWSEEEFGNNIGVTRQTIYNLENKKSKLTKTQFLAMKNVLEDEIKNSKEKNEMLICLLQAIVFNPEQYKDEQKKQILEKANMLAPAIITKTNSAKEVSNEFVKILMTVGISVGTIILAAGFGGPFFKGSRK